MKPIDVAVVIPCFNEEVAIPSVVKDFKEYLPQAKIYVFDNNSSDLTREKAVEAGATVFSEAQQGKGNVVRRMFGDIDADVYVLVDGDNTYDAKAAPRMVAKLRDECLDMVTGCRVSEIKAAYRPGHRFGNKMLTKIVTTIFGQRSRDMLSGYRVFSRRFVKSFPALSRGFEIETELTVHALEMRMPIADVDTRYVDRPEGSSSKLNTLRDGIRILRMIFRLVREERPLAFFSTIGIAGLIAAIALSLPVLDEYLQTGLVPRIPTVVLSAGLCILSALMFCVGIILDTVTVGRREAKRLAYLRFPILK